MIYCEPKSSIKFMHAGRKIYFTNEGGLYNGAHALRLHPLQVIHNLGVQMDLQEMQDLSTL